jgi:hypothetical protein
MKRCHWVESLVVGQVKFAEWTLDDQLRQPVFLGLRTKQAKDVVRELAVSEGRVEEGCTFGRGHHRRPDVFQEKCDMCCRHFVHFYRSLATSRFLHRSKRRSTLRERFLSARAYQMLLEIAPREYSARRSPRPAAVLDGNGPGVRGMGAVT